MCLLLNAFASPGADGVGLCPYGFSVNRSRATASLALRVANSERRIGLQIRLAILKDAARMPLIPWNDEHVINKPQFIPADFGYSVGPESYNVGPPPTLNSNTNMKILPKHLLLIAACLVA